jgi:plasmid stabilization system protein ParE
VYSITYRPVATKEYQDAISWYMERTNPAAEKLVIAINEKLDSICRNPKQYKNLYKNYYEVNTRKYPYCIVYFIEEALQQVVIVAIYHHKRHPKKKYSNR